MIGGGRITHRLAIGSFGRRHRWDVRGRADSPGGGAVLLELRGILVCEWLLCCSAVFAVCLKLLFL